MRIDPTRCVGCGKCLPYCGLEAIRRTDGVFEIELDACVECYVCRRSGICEHDAIQETPLGWPRIVRHTLSSVRPVQRSSGLIEGRGTAEMKTNDVTDRYRLGEVGFTVDVGRPGLGARFKDVQTVARALADFGVIFEANNPATELMDDPKSGGFPQDLLGERVLSCILEFKVALADCLGVIDVLRAVADQIDTVFSVGCISRCAPDGTVPVHKMLDDAGVIYRPNGKINIGLGRR